MKPPRHFAKNCRPKGGSISLVCFCKGSQIPGKDIADSGSVAFESDGAMQGCDEPLLAFGAHGGIGEEGSPGDDLLPCPHPFIGRPLPALHASQPRLSRFQLGFQGVDSGLGICGRLRHTVIDYHHPVSSRNRHLRITRGWIQLPEVSRGCTYKSAKADIARPCHPAEQGRQDRQDRNRRNSIGRALWRCITSPPKP